MSQSIELLTKPFHLNSTAERIVGCIISLLFLGSFTWLDFQIIGGFNLVFLELLIALAVIFVLILFFKLYRVFLRNSFLTFAISMYLGISAMIRFRPNKQLFENQNAAVPVITWIAFLLLFSGIAAFVLGILTEMFGDGFHPENFKKNLLTCGAVYFTVYVFLISETYYYNYKELLYTFLDFAPFFLIKTILYSLVTALLLCTLRNKENQFFTKLLNGLLLCIYVQYLFMNKSLAQLGETVEWNEQKSQMIWNAFIWVGILAFPFLLDFILSKSETLKQILPKIWTAIPAFIGSIQLVALIGLVSANLSALNTTGASCLSGTDQFKVSPNQNAVTFIVDMADQKKFEEIQKNSPERLAFLKDFTYYTNTAMEYDSTYLSIPSMLSAARCYPDGSVTEWYNTIFQDEPANTFYGRLRDNQYSVRIYGDFLYFRNYSMLDWKIKNYHPVTRNEIIIDKERLYNECEVMSAYRALPLFLKQYLEPYVAFGKDTVKFANACVTDNISFMEQNQLTYSDEEKSFIIQHFEGMHMREVPGDGLEGSIAILDSYIAQMKKLNVYDSSLIIITADHGNHRKPDNMPIWYIKRPYETNDSMQYCDAPISLTDYAATCLDVLGLYEEKDEEILGRSIYDIAEGEQRKRTVFQRPDFPYGKDVPKAPHGYYYWLGYSYIGTKADLTEHEINDPPDSLFLLDFKG